MTGRPIYTLRRGQCRFPIKPFETERHLFCAEPVEEEGATYCAEHAARCYDRRTSEKRRADQERAALARLAKKGASHADVNWSAMPFRARSPKGEHSAREDNT